jgi:hypothetical protein
MRRQDCLAALTCATMAISETLDSRAYLGLNEKTFARSDNPSHVDHVEVQDDYLARTANTRPSRGSQNSLKR